MTNNLASQKNGLQILYYQISIYRREDCLEIVQQWEFPYWCAIHNESGILLIKVIRDGNIWGYFLITLFIMFSLQHQKSFHHSVSAWCSTRNSSSLDFNNEIHGNSWKLQKKLINKFKFCLKKQRTIYTHIWQDRFGLRTTWIYRQVVHFQVSMYKDTGTPVDKIMVRATSRKS